MITSNETKTCFKCNKTKDIEEFQLETTHYKRVDGTISIYHWHRNNCKECRSLQQKPYQQMYRGLHSKTTETTVKKAQRYQQDVFIGY
jgi:hypothetical protein